MTELIKVGKAKLKVIGLIPERVSTNSEGRVPGKATFRGMDHQKTGMGEKVTVIEVITIPHVTGGLDAAAWLWRHHENQDTVNYIRLGKNYLGNVVGSVVVRVLGLEEENIHPVTKVGRTMTGEIELIHVGSVGGLV